MHATDRANKKAPEGAFLLGAVNVFAPYTAHIWKPLTATFDT